PTGRREGVFQLKRGRKLQDGIAVVPLSAGGRAIAYRDIEIALLINHWPRRRPDARLAFGGHLIDQQIAAAIGARGYYLAMIGAAVSKQPTVGHVHHAVRERQRGS